MLHPVFLFRYNLEMHKNSFKILFIVLVVVLLFPLTGCQDNTPTSTSSAITPSIIVKPSDTPEPMALLINGEGISNDEFEAELSRFQTAQTELGNTILIEQASQRVLDEFIDLVLLKQGAEAEGFNVDDAILQDRINNLVEQIGGIDTLIVWEQEHGYTDESLRVSLRRQI